MVAPTAPSPTSNHSEGAWPFHAATPVDLTSITPSPPSPPLFPSLPDLPAPDRSLLLRLIALNQDFETLAAELAAASPPLPTAHSPLPSPDLLSLLTWSTFPHIAAWLTYFRTTKDRARRELALTKLESLVKTSDSPVEQRRAATTLLRALDHKWPAADPRARSRNASIPPSPRSKRGEVSRGPFGDPPSDGEGDCSPSPQSPTTPPLESRILNLESPSSSSPSVPSCLSASVPSSLPPPPPPPITPALTHTPTTIARALAHDLQQPDPTQAFITLRAISTEAANEEDLDPLLARIETHLNLPEAAVISDPEHPGAPPGYENAARIRILHPDRPPIILEFLKLPRQPWLLDLFDTG